MVTMRIRSWRPAHPLDLTGKVNRCKDLHRDTSRPRCYVFVAHRPFLPVRPGLSGQPTRTMTTAFLSCWSMASTAGDAPEPNGAPMARGRFRMTIEASQAGRTWPLIWCEVGERVRGIEPPLSAWELATDHGLQLHDQALRACRTAGRCRVGDRGSPWLTVATGTRRARGVARSDGLAAFRREHLHDELVP